MGGLAATITRREDVSRGLGRTRRNPAPYHGRRPMGSQPGGWRERRNAADQLGGIRAWSPRAKVAGNLVGYGLPLRLRAGVRPRGRSWLAVQDPHDVLGGGDRRDGERERKRQLLEGRHAENGSTAGQERSLDDEAANREGPGDLRPRRPSEGFGTWHAISRSQCAGHRASGHLFLVSLVRQYCAGFQASHDASEDDPALGGGEQPLVIARLALGLGKLRIGFSLALGARQHSALACLV